MGMSGPFFTWNLPWRPPSLPHFAQTPRFRELHSAADDWIEQQFAHIHSEAASLVPAARLVSDYGTIYGFGCRWSADIGILRVRAGAFAHLRFHRQVAVAYGFDGDVSDQILELITVLEQAGWRLHVQTNQRSNPRERRDRGRADRRGVTRRSGNAAIPAVPGHPIHEIPTPSGEARGNWVAPVMPPHRRAVTPGSEDRPGPHTAPPCRAHLIWISRTEPSHILLDVAYAPLPETREASSYHPLEMTGLVPPTEVGQFAAPALDQHEHAVAVLIELDYYQALPGSTRQRDVPRRLVPKLR